MLTSLSLLVSIGIAGAHPDSTIPVAPRAPRVVTVHAKEFAFTAPKTVKAGVTTFRLVNDGKEMHHLTIVKLGDNKTMADFVAAMKNPGPPPSWTTFEGGPNAALPGGAAEATLSLEPGNYVMLCVIPSPGETKPHMAKGMMGPLTVLPAKAGASVPAPDATLHLTDYAFSIPATMTPGHHTINVINDAAQPHELVLVALAPGKSISDLGDWVEKTLMKGPPPGRPLGGVSILSSGKSGTFSVDLKPGTYGLICFAPDAKDGKSHAQHGMTKQFTVN